jgi:hypothetical protein
MNARGLDMFASSCHTHSPDANTSSVRVVVEERPLSISPAVRRRRCLCCLSVFAAISVTTLVLGAFAALIHTS